MKEVEATMAAVVLEDAESRTYVAWRKSILCLVFFQSSPATVGLLALVEVVIAHCSTNHEWNPRTLHCTKLVLYCCTTEHVNFLLVKPSWAARNITLAKATT